MTVPLEEYCEILKHKIDVLENLFNVQKDYSRSLEVKKHNASLRIFPGMDVLCKLQVEESEVLCLNKMIHESVCQEWEIMGRIKTQKEMLSDVTKQLVNKK